MASRAVMTAVRERLAAHWTHCPVIEANAQAEAPADGSPFLLVQFPVSNSQRATHSRTFREDGAIRFVLHVKRSMPLDAAMAWAEELAGLFREVGFGGIYTETPNEPSVDDRNENGNYFRLSIVTPYRRFHVG